MRQKYVLVIFQDEPKQFDVGCTVMGRKSSCRNMDGIGQHGLQATVGKSLSQRVALRYQINGRWYDNAQISLKSVQFFH